jgi:acyl-CoA synthetase (AMP-forming)/AMP-acid ligase II
VLDGLMVADPASLAPVPADGAAIGEVLMRGNIVMKGYLKNPEATEAAFAGGWFHTGDLGVRHPDGYIELKDRSKDISGGENISTVEVEDVLYRHPRQGAPRRDLRAIAQDLDRQDPEISAARVREIERVTARRPGASVRASCRRRRSAPSR